MDANTKKKVIVGSIIGLIVITGTALWLRNRKIRAIKKNLKNGSPDVLEASRDMEGQVIFPLEKGSGYTNIAENACVKVVQRYLNMKITENPSIGYNVLDEDGKFGLLTENALRRITGTTSVSYNLYKTMQADLVPKFLSDDTNAYTAPEVEVFDYLKL